MLKNCKRCKQDKTLDCFSVAQSNKGGYSHVCKPCVVSRNQEYWKTPVGRMSAIYATQVTSSDQRKHPRPTYTREELTSWALLNGLESLVAGWRESGYLKELVPSVDRHNPNNPYTLDNIRLVTWKENNDKAYEDRKSCTHITKQCKRIEQLTKEGQHVSFYDSVASASRATGITRTNINRMCAGAPQYKSVGGFVWRYAYHNPKEKK